MCISDFYNISFSILRNTPTSDTSIDGYTTIGTYQGVLEQVTDKTKLYRDGNMGNEFKLWCDATTPIRANDQITISSVKYSVIGSAIMQDLEDGSDSHLEIILSKK